MVWQPTPQQVALGVGANGALVDVSSFIVGPEGTVYSWGRQSEFRDPNPAQLTFVLENQDGRFTPGNTSSPYATPLSEGAAASWLIGSRLFGGTVSAIAFASSEQEWGRVTITVSDVFYIANRTQITGGLAGAIASAQALNYWPLTDAPGSGQAMEANGGPTLYPEPNPVIAPTLQFGVPATGPAADPQMTMSGPAGARLGTYNLIGQGWGTVGNFAPSIYPAGSAGAWGVWVTLSTIADSFGLTVQFAISSTWELDVNVTAPGAISLKLYNSPGAFTLTIPTTLVPGQAYYLAFALTYSGSPSTMTATVYLNGVAIGSQTYAAGGIGAGPNGVAITTTGVVSLSHLTHSPVLLHEGYAGPTTEANRLMALTQVAPSMNLGTIDPNVSTATVGVLNSGATLWSALCDLVRTEQGHLYTATTGTLLAPTSTVNMRARTRPATVTLTLDAAADLDGVPPFDRDITNLYGVVTAAGPGQSQTVADQAAITRVGTASTSETVDLVNPTDLLGYAQDRMIRGKNVALKVAQLVVNTATSTVTLAQLLGLNLGDRIRVANLPAGPLGFTQWDGWFLGASEVHNYLGDVFTLYVAPVLPATGVYDTDLFSAGTDLSLNVAITSSATSAVVTTANTALSFLETVQVPYTLQIDQEQVTVTACTALSGSNQTVTITRGANGTTPAAHNAGALVDVAPAPIYAF
jgi:hypothetical protein